MQKFLLLALISSAVLAAQSPEMTGFWKADLQLSKLGGPPGPPPSNYLLLIEQRMAVFNPHTKEDAPQLVETTGIWGQRGEQRSVLTVFTNGQPSVRPYQGVPTRLIASSEGQTLRVSGEVSGRNETFTRVYKLSPDHRTLTLEIVNSRDGRQTLSTLVLNKQGDSDASILRKPEELAETHYKNVKTAALKSLPTSEFINQMRYFAWSLNRDCEFCHVARKFDADDKEEKRTARKMIEMVATIDGTSFDGHPEVRCFTCHEGHAHPLSHPQFSDEAAAEKTTIEKIAAERAIAAQAVPSGAH